MATLIPVQYHGNLYPEYIKPEILEVAGNFDGKEVVARREYSLHTEYSFANRRFNSPIILKYPEICRANKKGIPQLWFSNDWSVEFAEFIKDITANTRPPKIIEVHPPFSDYCDLVRFLERYQIFKKRITSYFPNVIILIENRSGTRYSGGKFIVSTVEELVALSDVIDQLKPDLKITLDLPQLFTAHGISKSKKNMMTEIFSQIELIRHNILGIHLWGKKTTQNGKRIAHFGDLNDYFMNDLDFKRLFLTEIHRVFDDGIARYFVPEVNSGPIDLASIVDDLKEVGFNFGSYEARA